MSKPLNLGPRFGRVRLIMGVSDREQGQSGGLQLGCTTYGTNDNGDETYQVSYIEIGGRSDHVADAIANAQGTDVPERLVKEASAEDVIYVGTPKMNAKAQKAAADKAAAKSDDTQEAAAA